MNEWRSGGFFFEQRENEPMQCIEEVQRGSLDHAARR